MYLLNGKEDPRERRVKGRRHAGRRPTGDEEAFLSPAALERPRHRLTGHASKLDGRSLSTKREAGKRTERPLGELCCDYSVPGHIDAPDDLSVNLGDATPLGIGLPKQKLGDHHKDNGKNGKPRGHEDGVTCEFACDRAQALLGERKRQAVERYHSTTKKASKGALPHKIDLEPPRETTPYGELACRSLSHAQTTTLNAPLLPQSLSSLLQSTRGLIRGPGTRKRTPAWRGCADDAQ